MLSSSTNAVTVIEPSLKFANCVVPVNVAPLIGANVATALETANLVSMLFCRVVCVLVTNELTLATCMRSSMRGVKAPPADAST